MAGAEMAISVIQGLVVAAIQVAQAISDAIDEANDLMSQLPLVEAGLRTAKTALERHANIDADTRRQLNEYLKSLEQQIRDATKLMEDARARLTNMNKPPKGADPQTLAVFKRRVQRNRWFFMHRSSLQAVNQSIATSLNRIKFLLDLVEKHTKFVPASTIKDPEGRSFWQTYFGTANVVPWNLFFQSLQQHYYITYSKNIGQYNEQLRQVIDICFDGEITPFEMDQFLQWFAPLNGSVERAAAIGSKSYFCAGINRALAEDLVEPCSDGAFVVRWSSQVGRLAITYKVNGEKRHSLICMHGAKGCSFNPDAANAQPNEFKPTVAELIASRPDMFKISAVDEIRERQLGNNDGEAVGQTVANQRIHAGGNSADQVDALRGAGATASPTGAGAATGTVRARAGGITPTASQGVAQASPAESPLIDGRPPPPPYSETDPFACEPPLFASAPPEPAPTAPVRTQVSPAAAAPPVDPRHSRESIYGELPARISRLQL